MLTQIQVAWREHIARHDQKVKDTVFKGIRFVNAKDVPVIDGDTAFFNIDPKLAHSISISPMREFPKWT